MTFPLLHEAWGGWPWLAPLWILFWVVLIVTVITLLRRRGGAWCGPSAATATPAQILAERFARGEIDAAEYRSRLDVIGRQ
jgi:putative membrane protein